MPTDGVAHSVALRVRALRRARRLSQDDLASRTGFDRRYIGHIESGSVNPTVASIARIASGLSMRLCDFFDDEVFDCLYELADNGGHIGGERSAYRFASDFADVPLPAGGVHASDLLEMDPTDRIILDSLRRNPTATIADAAAVAGVSRATAARAVARLKDAGRISRVGSARAGHWVVCGDGNGKGGGA